MATVTGTTSEKSSTQEEQTELAVSHAQAAAQDGKVDFRVLMAVLALSFTYGGSLAITADMPAYISGNVAASFGPSASAQVGWISSAWTVGCAVTVVIGGRLSDIFGRRPFFLFANVISLVGSVVAATAKSYPTLIGGIALTGVGGGLANCAVPAASELLPNKWRPLGIAVLELSVGPLGYFGGNAIAHVIVERTGSYKWVFYAGILNAGVCLAMIAMFYWPPSHPLEDGKSKWEEFKEIDFFGLFLFAAGLVIFLLGIIWGGGLYSWRNPHTFVPTIVGFLTLVALAFWSVKKGDNALIPPRLFKNNFRGMTTNCLCAFVAGMIFFSGGIIWPSQVGNFYATSYIEIGVLGIPQGTGFLIGGVILGALCPYLGSTRWQLVVMNVWQGVFFALMALMTPTSRGAAIALILLANIPFIQIMNLTFLHTQFSTLDKDIGVACGVINAIRNAGGAIGVAIYVAALNNKIAVEVPKRVTQAALASGLPQSSVTEFVTAFATGVESAYAALPGVTSDIIANATNARQYGLASGYRLVYLITIPFSLVAILAAFFTDDCRKHLTSHTAVQLEVKSKSTDAEKTAL